MKGAEGGSDKFEFLNTPEKETNGLFNTSLARCVTTSSHYFKRIQQIDDRLLKLAFFGL